MAQRGRQSNNDGTGASKKNKSVQNQSQNKRIKQQKTRFPAAKINPINKTPKTKEKPPKTTTVHGKTTKTKQNHPYQTNQIDWQEKNST